MAERDYISTNKEAWEDAFHHRIEGWGEDVVQNIRGRADFYINPAVRSVLDERELASKRVAQFCCNNGRELLSISGCYGAVGTGFDIAENMIAQGKRAGKELGLPCEFVAVNVLEIGPEYDGVFDVILFTIGAITWFKDLEELFDVVSRCLRPGGIMVMHEIHPVFNMLPLPGEDGYRSDLPLVLEQQYFSKEPWLESNGMSYISGTYRSKTFTSFAHSMSEIVNSAIRSHMDILLLNEYDYDIGLSEAYDNKGLPLSMLLVCEKR